VTNTENQYYLAMAPAFLDECAPDIAAGTPPGSGTTLTNVTLTNLTTPADTYGTMLAHNDMFGSTTTTPISASDFNTISFDNPATVANQTTIVEQGQILPNTNGAAFGSSGKTFTASLYSASFARSGGAMANGCDLCGPFVFSPVHPLLSADTPTIAGSGCGGTVATIQNPNGTAHFDIFTGTAPTSGGCTITLPTANTAWKCDATHTSAISTTNFIIQQTGALSTTSATLQLFSDVAAATAPAASDTWRTSCWAN
jgi:hypothetical protein